MVVVKMQYKITIENFDGPLDLLLHLIKENDIDIYDIKIEEITKQYLDYIKAMKDLNLSIASEYLVMASELIEMKSRMLLPKQKQDSKEEYEEDPREVLIERLLAYKKYKEITSEFKNLEMTRRLIITKEPENLSFYAKESEKSDDVSLDNLIEAFNTIIERKKLDAPITTKITKKELSLSDKIASIKKILSNKKTVKFEELFDVQTKQEVIVSFLSILEMIKKDEIIVKQENNFKTILISLKEGEQK